MTLDLRALKVRGYGDHDSESFDDYISRWPAELDNFPHEVVKDWVWRHWQDFSNLWLHRDIGAFTFERKRYSRETILGIGRFDSWDDLAARFLDPHDDLDIPLGHYMTTHGTFPVPIIVAANCEGLTHPRGLTMRSHQLIEGHRRLGMLRGLIALEHPSLQEHHVVWELTLPRGRFATPGEGFTYKKRSIQAMAHFKRPIPDLAGSGAGD